MPDGFEPHRELERIYTLREMMQSCRERTPKVLAIIDDILDNPEVSPETKLRACDMIWNRGYGKAIQQVRIIDQPKSESPVRIVLPDNGRPNLKLGPVIDAT